MKGKSDGTGRCFVLNIGAKMPAIRFRTWQSSGDLCVKAVKVALSVGCRHIDCAHLCGNEVEAEEALADGFKLGSLKREDLFLTSKLYCNMNSTNKIENSVSVSLKNLGVQYLDVYISCIGPRAQDLLMQVTLL